MATSRAAESRPRQSLFHNARSTSRSPLSQQQPPLKLRLGSSFTCISRSAFPRSRRNTEAQSRKNQGAPKCSATDLGKRQPDKCQRGLGAAYFSSASLRMTSKIQGVMSAQCCSGDMLLCKKFGCSMYCNTRVVRSVYVSQELTLVKAACNSFHYKPALTRGGSGNMPLSDSRHRTARPAFVTIAYYKS